MSNTMDSLLKQFESLNSATGLTFPGAAELQGFLQSGGVPQQEAASIAKQLGGQGIEASGTSSDKVAAGLYGQLIAAAGGNVELGKKAFDSDRKSTRLNSSHIPLSRMPSSA